jgi:riboflavin biosynthesis pyrimidine reductase
MTWTERFTEFVCRKQGEAVDASLPPYVSDAAPLEPRAAGLIAAGNEWTRSLFDGDFYMAPPPPDRPACSLVFVQSRDGNTGARNPSALGGGETDKHLIYEGLSRVAADAVMAGAETIRGGRIVLSVWHPELVRLRESLGRPRHPIQIVATLQGIDIEHEMLFNVPEVPVMLLTVGACRTLMGGAIGARPWITPVVMDTPDQLPAAFERLRSHGIERISCIGGRRIAAQLIDAGLVQDVYLTTAAQPGGEPGTPMYPKPLNARVAVRKRGTGPEAGVVFEHLVL